MGKRVPRRTGTYGPAVGAILFSNTFSHRLFIGWGLGVLASLAGITASYFWDLPTGAAIVTALGATLALISIFSLFRR